MQRIVSRRIPDRPPHGRPPLARALLVSVSLLASLLLIAPAGAFELGVNYHAHTANFTTDTFLPEYHTGTVRADVQEQLGQMAAAGVDFVFTRIFIGAPQGSGVNSRTNRYHFAFPPTPQDLDNLDAYIADVHDAGLTLDLGFIWEAQANFEEGCVNGSDQPSNCSSPGLGSAHLLPEDPTNPLADTFKSRTITTLQSIFTKIETGEVRTFYFDTEAYYHPNPNSLPANSAVRRIRRNQNWFFENAYGNFAQRCTNHNTQPSVYFLFTVPNNPAQYPGGILNDQWHQLSDPQYPVTQGHRTMYNAYRSVRFVYDKVAQKRWPSSWLPPRFDLSIYADTTITSDYRAHIRRIVEDAEAVFVDNPEFNFSGVGAVEMGFLGDCTKREDLWDALLTLNNIQNPGEPVIQGLDSVSFWTTPYKSNRTSLGYKAWSHITDFDGGANSGQSDPNVCY